jgi:hypothetical protein
MYDLDASLKGEGLCAILSDTWQFAEKSDAKINNPH